MKNLIILSGLLFVWAGCSSPQTAQAPAGASPEDSYQLVWSDEFDTDGAPDSTRWRFDLGNGCPERCGWGNNEAQYYTTSPRNARQQNGLLVIEAHREPKEDHEYTSAKLLTEGRGDWQYGKILVRAKLPEGRGTWPAIWMLPTLDRPLNWPLDGEIDIMEHVGFDMGVIHGTIHTKAFNHLQGTQLSGQDTLTDASEQFHEYGLVWTPEELVWQIDGEPFYRIENPEKTEAEWPFDKPFHLILNLAVGGNWGGMHGVDTTIWPQRMEVDYVRVYQKDASENTGASASGR